MKLFGSYTSPFVRHCRIVLAQNNEAFELVPTDYAQSAAQSPAKRVPFLHDGDVQLHDSSAIVRYLRERAGQAFCQSHQSFDTYCLVNTALDTAINLFLLERDGFTPEQVPYLQRQQARLHAILDDLNQRDWGPLDSNDDAAIRLACLLSWGQFRERFNVQDWPTLQAFLAQCNQQPWFANTHPALS